jgi:FADH2 O2-dependent halogenase
VYPLVAAPLPVSISKEEKNLDRFQRYRQKKVVGITTASSKERLPVTTSNYDVAIIGGGIGGSLLGTVLTRNGVRVVLFEGSPHPRFAIGESTTPDSTFRLRVLGTRYDVPEIAGLAAYATAARGGAKSTGVKRGFSFVHHKPGEEAKPRESTQFPTLAPPLGPDVHFFRQDVDAYLFQTALRYGADAIYDRVVDVQFDADGAELTSASGSTVRADYVVDAGGRYSLLADRLGLRDAEPRFRTRSRSIFTHMIGVMPWESVWPDRRSHKLPIPPSQTTLHHMFEGGWMWVIPFDNHHQSANQLCSVGITLDIDRYPLDENVTAEAEFWEIVQRYPSVAKQFEHARPARPFVRVGRTQFSSQRIIGDRFCMLPHASDFVDPLFSVGLAVTVSAVDSLAHRLIEAARDNDYPTEKFQYVEQWTKSTFDQADELVAGCYTAFGDFALWNAFYRVWMINQTYGPLSAIDIWLRYQATRDKRVFEMLEQQPHRGVGAADMPQMRELLSNTAHEVRLVDKGELTPAAAAERIFAHLAASNLAPAPWNMLDAEAHCPSGTFGVLNVLKVFAWAKLGGPDFLTRDKLVRESLFVAAETVRQIGKATGDAARDLGRYLADHRGRWNRSWKRVERRYSSWPIRRPATPPAGTGAHGRTP